MIDGQNEAKKEDVHEFMYKKWQTEILERSSGEDTAKFILAGTMWSDVDLLNRLWQDIEAETPIIPSPDFKYVWEAKNGKAVFIRVPALDEQDKSTCEAVHSTEYYIRKRNNTEPYDWQCIYQQDPIPAEGIEFADENLQHYDTLPKNEDGTPAYSDVAFAVIDPARRGKDNVSMPICVRDNNEPNRYYMIDVIYRQKAMSELYDLIVDKIIQHNIVNMCVENNTDTSLKKLLEDKLETKGYTFCTITEKYNTVKKELRIMDQRGNIINNITFKDKTAYTINTDYGKFMKALTNYSFDRTNKHDDAPDSLALFVSEIAMNKRQLNKPKAINRLQLGV